MHIFNLKSGFHLHRPFEAHRIPNTNLILISIDMEYSSCYLTLSVNQEVIIYYKSDVKHITNRKQLPEGKYTDIPACNKKGINSYPRKKLRGCSDKLVLVSMLFDFSHISYIIPTID